jgi:hypothetical protein
MPRILNSIPILAATPLFWLSGVAKGIEEERRQVRPCIELTRVDDEAIGYATFQSHNQKVVSNRHGIFLTHLRTRNQAYTAQTWRLSRSTDGGQSFATVHEATHATNPPVIETDDDGNVYLVRVDFSDGSAYLHRFLADRQFREPIITEIPGAAAGKYAMFLDPQRQQLYFFAHNNSFHVIGLDGTVHRSLRLLRPGPNAVLQYPLLSLGRDGTLHAAWTTQKHGKYLYWDIHHMLSSDAGDRWYHLDGTPLTPPVIADQDGGALRITLEDEYDVHTWLSCFLVKGGKIHFMYQAQTKPSRQHYVRYDIASGKRDQHRQPEFRGTSVQIRGLDGFFATRTTSADSPLYCVGHDQGRVACLVSKDNGDTWQDYARTEEVFSLYSLGGCRQTTEDDDIIGTFTDQAGSNLTTDRKSKVYFFRIKSMPHSGAR